MTYRQTVLPALLILGLSACEKRAADPVNAQAVEPDAAGRAQVAAIMGDVQHDATDARISALENQVDALSAKMDASEVAVLNARVSALEARAQTSPSQDARPSMPRAGATPSVADPHDAH
ncbi:hypothetical protein [Sphingomonas oligophenolica]|uniref:Uncharacterized protein n=1 Tax=Sphingomonas oligophenolica TaxID=301154 RepID=A0A502BZB0_9SPHN|nr:hypothetical protein [Sphingomonas oligophenolica]TPG06575.1 hypothetical protein EAH84_14730 [Sphingomonas oligophenolica]